ncbi:hypothetical protein N5C80_26600 [Pseudomonas nicosulfuronedens]|uniref:hypothetical protein n=1 Tax=Pseudomonas nicosulfuronedens TaxID=2571105 RepID=UPI002446A472|nr:hypothetical protein [Pseudomonas nicosulfuronedens]MDH1012318.1 hypothetical protein [Pseudomonas nicosulfuronedens]MDH2030487.1 hypothetical protein [Pseudomonas nicosulfuronedens]
MYGAFRNKPAGGPITGPGTGTSDSIQTEVPEGTYILPADTTQALGFGARRKAMAQPPAEPQGFGARRKQIPVNVSAGEFEVTPDQVHALGVQVLDGAKAATHAQMPETASQGREMFFANGGLVDDPNQSRLPGNAGRAQQMQSQYDQPVTGPRGVVGQAASAAPALPRLGTGDLGKWLSNQPTTRMPEYRFGARRQPLSGESGGAGSSGQLPTATQSPAVSLSAPSPAAATPATASPALTPERIQAMTRQAVRTPFAGGAPDLPGINQALPEDNGWRRTGFGARRQGGDIAARVGANGQAEFSNDAGTVASASGNYGNFGARRSAGTPAAQPGYGAFRRTPEDLASTGTAANLGNGVGTFSQAQAGDAQLALDRFERANQQRQQMVQTAQRGELGNNGGQVNIVRDSSRSPTISEVQNARLEGQLARTDALRQNSNSDAALASQRIASEQQQMGTEDLQQQRLAQQVQGGDFDLQQQDRIDQLRAQLADPSLSDEQRAQVQQAYTYLTTPAKDRYRGQDVILGRDETGKDIRGTQLIDVTTGQPVAGGTTQGAPLRNSVTRAEVESTAKQYNMSPEEIIRQLQAKGVKVS